MHNWCAICLVLFACLGGMSCAELDPGEEKLIDEDSFEPSREDVGSAALALQCWIVRTEKKWYPLAGNFCDDLTHCDDGREYWSGWHKC